MAKSRIYSTFIEIFRCIKVEYPELKVKELVDMAVDRYNNTVHSVTLNKPSDIFFNRTQRINYQNLVDFRSKVNSDLRTLIDRNMKNRNLSRNRRCTPPKKYRKGDESFVANKGIMG